MKVQIEDDLFIESDERQFIVRRYIRGGKQSDKKQAINLAYYSSLQACVKHIVKLKVKESTAQTLAELVQDVERIERYIESKINL